MQQKAVVCPTFRKTFSRPSSKTSTPTMRFIMSTRLAWGANYCNEEGQVLFRTESPGPRSTGQDVTVFRIVPPCMMIDNDPAEVVGDAELRDVYENVGEIHYRVYRSSSIVYQGVCHLTDTFFRKGSRSSSWRQVVHVCILPSSE
jgi:hypothetical protein